jgi:hypothetical protein
MAVRSALCAGRLLPPRKIHDTQFCLRMTRPQDHSAAERIRSIEESKDLIGNRSLDLPACTIVSQSTTLSRAPNIVPTHILNHTSFQSMPSYATIRPKQNAK